MHPMQAAAGHWIAWALWKLHSVVSALHLRFDDASTWLSVPSAKRTSPQKRTTFRLVGGGLGFCRVPCRTHLRRAALGGEQVSGGGGGIVVQWHVYESGHAARRSRPGGGFEACIEAGVTTACTGCLTCLNEGALNPQIYISRYTAEIQRVRLQERQQRTRSPWRGQG